jgi:4-diphosphocytidyl-2-C-methyl-D-erythritol kinase
VRLRALAPGKINLCLRLGGMRADGRHQLVTLFESVSLADELMLCADPGAPAAHRGTGFPVAGAGAADEVICPGVSGENLVARALAALRVRGWEAPPVRIEIAKRIPIAAGMGGGSADAAAALRLASELAPGRPEEVAVVAASLGADVPSQLCPGVVLGTGAGELIEPFPPLAQHALVVIPLPYAVATPDVYREADRLGLPRSPEELSAAYERLLEALRPGARLADELLVNDLEPAAISLCPAVSDALRAAREAGAEPSLVCGSGPTVAGLFWGDDALGGARRAAAALAAGYPAVTVAEPVAAEFGAPQVRPSSPSGTISASGS